MFIISFIYTMASLSMSRNLVSCCISANLHPSLDPLVGRLRQLNVQLEGFRYCAISSTTLWP